jgi:DNA-binding NtrC family response regulator/tetratricopeptide (TPR) repeat protein
VPDSVEQPALSQAQSALLRGQGAEAVALLTQALKTRLPRREDELRLRLALVEAHLLRDDLVQASRVLGRLPHEAQERTDPARLAAQWRLHGEIALAHGDPSRAIAITARALRHAERARDSHAIGLAHYGLARCYRQVGDTATVREHLAKAASALHAAGDHRALALVHSLSGVALAQEGRHDEAVASLRHAERLAGQAEADDVLATACGNLANVMMMQHRHEQALVLAERSVALQEQSGSPHGLGVALASLGQICVRLGNLTRAEEVLNRALDVPSPEPFRRETTGAVFDTLAQIHLIRGACDAASECLAKASDAYGEQASRWYQWSIRVLEAKLALRRGQFDRALALADEIVRSPAAPPAYALQGELIGAEAVLLSEPQKDAAGRLAGIGGRLHPRDMPGTWGEFLRLRGRVHARSGSISDGYHDLGQSISVFELLGERYQAGLSHLALGDLAASAGARSKALRYLNAARSVFDALGAAPDLAATDAVLARVPVAGTGEYVGVQPDGDDALVRRLVDAAALPEVLEREVVQAAQEACDADAAVLFVRLPGDDARLVAFAGCERQSARALASATMRGAGAGPGSLLVEAMGSDADGPRLLALASARAFGSLSGQRFRTLCAIARQGFELCQTRERSLAPVTPSVERALEPLFPGFICASPVMVRVAEQIQRLQGNDLTVLITGESGTGKDLVARAIHGGSLRRNSVFLPFNCTSATRDLADSQLFGHRRGSFTGAMSDQPGVLRSAAGGSIFLDEIGDLPLDVQPKLLRFLEQGEILPVGETRPIRVDVRVIAATNANLERRVAEARFREDLYYRLGVIHIHVPPLRERHEEIPHLASFFLREASERLAKPEVRLSQATLELFDDYTWPGNVRQLRNEIQRAVALAQPGSAIEPEHLSRQLVGMPSSGGAPRRGGRATLAEAVGKLERETIRTALEQTSGNISQTARLLGLTRRGLYLKMQRLGLESR